mmetsp:Transcript_10958/g.15373  ORF Transcript_10958/g.15373 Transcript_10958/m.15373 type:complete len:102 (+) Transcript_10958:917-1222(+)
MEDTHTHAFTHPNSFSVHFGVMTHDGVKDTKKVETMFKWLRVLVMCVPILKEAFTGLFSYAEDVIPGKLNIGFVHVSPWDLVPLDKSTNMVNKDTVVIVIV